MDEGPSRFGTFAGVGCSLGALVLAAAAGALGLGSRSMRMDVSSLFLGGWDTELIRWELDWSGSGVS